MASPNSIYYKQQRTPNPNRKPKPVDNFRLIIDNDFYWLNKKTRCMIPIERLPQDHWDFIRGLKGDNSLWELVSNVRESLIKNKIARWQKPQDSRGFIDRKKFI